MPRRLVVAVHRCEDFRKRLHPETPWEGIQKAPDECAGMVLTETRAASSLPGQLECHVDFSRREGLASETVVANVTEDGGQRTPCRAADAPGAKDTQEESLLKKDLATHQRVARHDITDLSCPRKMDPDDRYRDFSLPLAPGGGRRNSVSAQCGFVGAAYAWLMNFSGAAPTRLAQA